MTPGLPAEIQTLIEAHIQGFNTLDDDLFLSVFGDTAIIIDGIAPYRWLNPNAPEKWLADAAKWRADLGVTREHLSYEMTFWNVEGASAYAVVSGTLTITMKEQTIVRTGTLAYTFARREGRLEDRSAGLGPHVIAARSRGEWREIPARVDELFMARLLPGDCS